MKLVRYLAGDYKGRCLVEEDDRAAELVEQGYAVYANQELEYMTREMTAAKPKKRGRPNKAEEETPADED